MTSHKLDTQPVSKHQKVQQKPLTERSEANCHIPCTELNVYELVSTACARGFDYRSRVLYHKDITQHVLHK